MGHIQKFFILFLILKGLFLMKQITHHNDFIYFINTSLTHIKYKLNQKKKNS